MANAREAAEYVAEIARYVGLQEDLGDDRDECTLADEAVNLSGLRSLRPHTEKLRRTNARLATAIVQQHSATK